MVRATARLAVVVAAFSLVVALPARAAFAFSDVPRSYWDMPQIRFAAITHTWMQDYGRDLFYPTRLETRSFLARTLVTVYAPEEPVDPSIHFSDLADDDPLYPYANVAVKLGWLGTYSQHRWAGGAPVRTFVFDKAVVLAMGTLSEPLAGLASIHQSDGTPYAVGATFPHQQLARWLGLHFDHGDERLDLGSRTRMKRDEVAYSLWAALTLPSWRIDAAQKFADVTLPLGSAIRTSTPANGARAVRRDIAVAISRRADSTAPGSCGGCSRRTRVATTRRSSATTQDGRCRSARATRWPSSPRPSSPGASSSRATS